jgi:hypothetical protein
MINMDWKNFKDPKTLGVYAIIVLAVVAGYWYFIM